MEHEHHHSPHHQSQAAPPPPPPVPAAFSQNFNPAPSGFTAPAEPTPQAPQPTAFTYSDPQSPVTPPAAPGGLMPQPVVQVLSPRGVEYVFLTITLFTGAIGLIAVLLSLVNGETGFDVLSFPVALLLVSLPVFAWLFLRLKAAELQNPSLSLDASKRRSTQTIQIVSFMTCFFTLIGFITTIFAKLSGSFDGSMLKVFLDILVLLVVSGGILAYYWRDEHRS